MERAVGLAASAGFRLLLGQALTARDADAAANSARRIIYFMQQEVTKDLVARGGALA